MFKQQIVLFFLLVSAARAEVHSLTLRQVLDLAARQNPDVTLARLDERRAEQGVSVAEDPFRPKVYAGSGLAYTYGYPNSIEGNAPSLFQVKTDMALYNKPKRYQLASARESAHGFEYGTQSKIEDVAYQTVDLFLTAQQMEHEDETLANQLPSLQKVVQIMNAAVGEGSELPVEVKRARVNLASSQQRMQAAHLDTEYYETMLAVALGYPASDLVKPLESPLPPTDIGSIEQVTETALRNNRELRHMQSNVLARELDLRAYKASRLPQVDLVAQYALFAKYNYVNYFQKFQANNAQIGASVTIPIFIGSATKGLAGQAGTDLQKMRIQMEQVRNRISTDTKRSYEQWEKAVAVHEVARMQLDLAREDLTVILAQNGEGRIPMSRVEQARLAESDRWIGMYEAETQVTRAKLSMFRQMGTLLATLQVPGSAIQEQSDQNTSVFKSK